MPRTSPLVKSIRLKNFKAFQDTGVLPLKRITLLVGKNSAGKSSLIKSILGASQTSRQASPDDSYFRLIGDYTNLGTYTDTVHENNVDTDFSIGFGLEDSKSRSYILDYTFSKNDKSSLGALLKGVKVHHDGELLLSGRKPKVRPFKDRWLGGKRGIVLTYPKITDSEIFEPEDPTKNMPDFIKKLEAFMASEKGDIKEEQERKIQISVSDFSLNISLQEEDGGVFQFGTERKLQPYIGETEIVSRKLDKVLSNAIYLSGLREEPTREARLAQSSGNRIGIKGEDLATMLHQRRDNNEFMNRFNSHLQILGIAEKAITAPSYMKNEGKEVETGYIKILLHKQGKDRSLMDLGYGTSQVLPVVFELGLRKNKLILIEQPELHLHPAAQSEIGSLLNLSIEQGNQLIVETHSANLIERLRRLIREGELDNNDVNIIYIGMDNECGGSRCDVIGFDAKGEFTETWPEESFFGERELEYLNW